MIIDFQTNAEHAALFEVLDANTWQPLETASYPILYADDQKGIVRVALLNESGEFRPAFATDPQRPMTKEEMQSWRIDMGNLVIAWREEKRPIRIVKKQVTAS